MDLPRAIHHIFALVEELTEKPVILRQENNLPAAAKIKMARANMDAHVILYKNTAPDILPHLIAHECGHVLRTFRLPPEKRRIVSTTFENRQMAYDHIKTESIYTPLDHILQQNPGLLKKWHDGLVLQLINVKPDIEIENWLFKDFPELRDSQEKSIVSVWKEAIQSLSPDIKRMSPKTLYIASNALNYVQYRAFSDLTGNADYVNPYIGIKDIRIGDKMFKMLRDLSPDDYESDFFFTNQWAEMFGLSKWFTWTDFENVPPDYMDII